MTVPCDIAAGLDGIEQGLQPTAPCLTDGYAVEDAQDLPTSLADAVALAKASELVQRVLGDDRLTILTQQAEREIDFINNQVTPIEFERYARNL
jgi:glutamine synthetase